MKIIDRGNRIGFEIEEGDDPELHEMIRGLMQAVQNEDADEYAAVVRQMMQRPELADAARKLMGAVETLH